jgi:hypothetical protein
VGPVKATQSKMDDARSDKRRMARNREPGVSGVDHLPPSLDTHRPKAFAKKSRSTSN